MESALVNLVANNAAFADASVAAVEPCVERDGARAAAVKVTPAPRIGSLSRARVTMAVVCPRHDEQRFRTMAAAIRSYEDMRTRLTDAGRSWRVIRFALVDTDSGRTVDGYLHFAARFDATYKEL